MKKFRCSVLFKFSFIIFLIEYLSYMFWEKKPKGYGKYPFHGEYVHFYLCGYGSEFRLFSYLMQSFYMCINNFVMNNFTSFLIFLR